jgi:ATP-dependent Lhr-like helicase
MASPVWAGTGHRPTISFLADIWEREFVEWVERSFLLKSAFREVAVIGGLVERQHPGKRKTGRQVSFSTDLIYDVLRKYEPSICCCARHGTMRGPA